VDVVLEDRTGKIVGIEVKAGASVAAQDFKGLRALAEITGKRFHRGIVLLCDPGCEAAAGHLLD